MPPSAQPELRPDPTLDELIATVVRAAADKQATQIRVLDVREVVGYTDAAVLLSGASDRQVLAIVDHVEDQMRAEHGAKPAGEEGRETASWVCLDYGDLVAHVFYSPARAYYEMDNLWPEAVDRTGEFDFD